MGKNEHGEVKIIDKSYLVNPNLALACQKFIRHMTNYQFGWFDREIKKTFGIDIYDYPFDKKRDTQLLNRIMWKYY